MIWLKNNLIAMAILVMAMVIYFQRCNDKNATSVSKRDTTVSVQYIQQPQQNIPQYQPIIIESKQPVNIPQQYQPAADQTILIKQYQELVNKFIARNISNDTIGLKDSSGRYAGTVKINDVVSENEIKERNASYVLNIPVITKMVTVTEPYKPHGQLYIGGGINGSKTNYVSAFDAGLMWKNKKDQLYGLKAGLSTTGNISFGISSYWKIKLHK